MIRLRRQRRALGVLIRRRGSALRRGLGPLHLTAVSHAVETVNRRVEDLQRVRDIYTLQCFRRWPRMGEMKR